MSSQRISNRLISNYGDNTVDFINNIKEQDKSSHNTESINDESLKKGEGSELKKSYRN